MSNPLVKNNNAQELSTVSLLDRNSAPISAEASLIELDKQSNKSSEKAKYQPQNSPESNKDAS